MAEKVKVWFMTSDPKIKKLPYKALTSNNLYHL